MKTALQQAFARLEELHPSLFDIHTEKGRTFVNEFSKFLEVEREQIIYARATAPILPSIDKADYFIEALEYYNLTFK